MAQKKLIQVLRGVIANIPVLADGQPFFATDTHSFYVGWSGTNYNIGPAAPGTTDHAALTHLAWPDSGHTGTALSLAGFDAGGAAVEVSLSSLGSGRPDPASFGFGGF